MTVIQNSFSKETHPWTSYIPESATKLFIGTFPTEKKNRKVEFFYSGSRGRFWDIIKKLPGIRDLIFTNVDEIVNRKIMLNTLNMGLTDMGFEVLRQTGSSSDHSLFPLQFMDIESLINANPKINKLFVSGKSPGNSALRWLGIYCDLNNVEINVKQIYNQKFGVIKLGGRELSIILVTSPSRQAIGISDEALLEEYSLLLI